MGKICSIGVHSPDLVIAARNHVCHIECYDELWKSWGHCRCLNLKPVPIP